MTRVKVRVEGHYEVEKLPYGKDYKWVPAHARVECECGRVMEVDTRHTVCPGCGTDHTQVVREIAGRHLSEDVLHPWRPDYEAWVRSRRSHSEEEEWQELRTLD